MIILPVVVNPIFAYPSLGVVTTVWVSASIPENDAEYEVKRSENHIIVAMGRMVYSMVFGRETLFRMQD